MNKKDELINKVNNCINNVASSTVSNFANTVKQISDNKENRTTDSNTNKTYSILSSVWKVRFKDVILERGQQYYERGLVEQLTKDGDNFSAIVKGTDDYQVSLTIKKGKIITSVCNCLNAEEGYLCKHMAAVLFAIENFQEDKNSADNLSLNQLVTNNKDDKLIKNTIVEMDDKKNNKKEDLASMYSQYASKGSDFKNVQNKDQKKEKIKTNNKKIEIDNNFNPDILDRKVKYWQHQLLDHGKRNKMMHFRETARTTLNLTSPSFEDLFSRLVIKEETLSFRKPLGKNDDARMYSLVQMLQKIDSNIQFAKGDIETTGTYSATESALYNLKNKAQLALDEQGTNILYLCFGFIEWRRKVTSKGEEDWMKSPLILVPVNIFNASLLSSYQLKRRDDDIVVNPTLSHLFQEQYRITLPTLDSNPKLNDVIRFMNDVEELATSRGWRISRECCIGLMSFLKITMYNDMVKNEKEIKANPIIRAFAGEVNKINDLEKISVDYDHDHISSMNAYQVLDADSSQQDAIQLSKSGISFVLQGPPGTGKSQTITNIIAEGLADGKKILFVSEKLAALEVVYKRLKDVNLEQFCLPLHNHKANRKDVIYEIGMNLDLHKPRVKADQMVTLAQLDALKLKLNSYIRDIHQPIKPLDMTLYDVYGFIAQEDGLPFINVNLPNITDMTKQDYYQLLMLVKAFDNARIALGDKLNTNPWIGSKIDLLENNQKDLLLQNLNNESRLLEKLSEITIGNKPITHYISYNTIDDLEEVKVVLESCKVIPSRWFKGNELYSNLEQEVTLLNKLMQATEVYSKARAEILEHFDDDFLKIDGKVMHDVVVQAMNVMQFEYANEDPESIFSKRETTRENLVELIDVVSSFRDTLKELRITYGFSDNISVITFGRIIKALRILLEKYPFTKYYFGNGARDIKETVNKAQSLISDADQIRYEISKDYLDSIFEETELTNYIKILKDAEGFVENLKDENKYEVFDIQKYVDSRTALKKEIENINNNQVYNNVLEKYSITLPKTYADMKLAIKSIDNILKNPNLINEDVEKQGLLLSKAKEQKKALDTTREEYNNVLNQLQINENSVGSIDDLTKLKGVYNNVEELIEICDKDETINYLVKLTNLISITKDTNAKVNQLRKDVSIKSVITNKQLLSYLNRLPEYLKLSKINDYWVKDQQAISSIIKKQKKLVLEISQCKGNILRDFSIDVFTVDADVMLERFEKTYTGIFRSFNSQYKDDIKLMNNYALSTTRLKNVDIITVLNNIKLYQSLMKEYTQSANVKKYFDIETYDVDYDWDSLQASLDYIKELLTVFENNENVIDFINNKVVDNIVEAINRVPAEEEWNKTSAEGTKLIGNLYQAVDTNVDGILYDISKLQDALKVCSDKNTIHKLLLVINKDQLIDEVRTLSSTITLYTDWFNRNEEELKSLFNINSPILFNGYDNLIQINLEKSELLKPFSGNLAVFTKGMSIDDIRIVYSTWNLLIDFANKYHYGLDTDIATIMQTKFEDLTLCRNVLDVYEKINIHRFRDVQFMSISQLISQLESVIKFNDATKYIQSYNNRNQMMLGDVYQGLNTNWNYVNEMVSAAEVIVDLFEEKVDRLFLNALLEKQVLYKEEKVKNLERLFNDFIRLSDKMTNLEEISIHELVDVIDDEIYALDIIKYCTEKVDQYCINDITYSELVSALETLGVLQNNLMQKENLYDNCQTMLPEFSLTDLMGIKTTLNNIESIRHLKKLIKNQRLNYNLVEWMVQNDTNKSELINVIDKIGQFKDEFETFIKLFDNEEELNKLPFNELKKRIDRGIQYFGLVGQSVDLKECEKNCIKAGLGDFLKAIESNNNLIGKLDRTFSKAFYGSWIIAQAEHIDVLKNFQGSVQAECVKQYVKMDANSLKLARIRVNEKLISKMPSKDSSLGKGEMSILLNEIDKKSGFMPLRKLFVKIPKLLLQLKPCLMMSPLSVSYYLESSHYKFDMVIFDEASQIFPQDAIGAISRGKQVIIVGDTKQLPPTNFFSTKTITGEDVSDEEDDNDLAIVTDSILEEANNHLLSRSLLWHYRSKDEALISFSNRQIYNSNLITFPSSKKDVKDNGVEYIYVSKGVYRNQVNEYEATRCVELVKEHILQHPNRSLGIIAFSEKQQALIEEKIRRWRIRNKQYESFFSENNENPFFVKNLENVQGDERDTIIFSICYGKDESGRLYYRFGPLGAAGGERRLNVAITRAKYNIKLVGSILPDDLDMNRINSEGARQLRCYIEYALNGVSVLNKKKTIAIGNTDPFIESVSSFLKEIGYEVKINVGDSDYTVNIGVVNPMNKDQFVVGIECDGTTYRSAKTSRDRDHLRPRILKNMGWTMYHIWSTEWVKNTSLEKQKLKRFIEKEVRKVNERSA